MGRTKRGKVSAEGAVRSQVVSIVDSETPRGIAQSQVSSTTDPGTAISSVTVTHGGNPVTNIYIPNKRPNFDDDPMELKSTSKMKSQLDDEHDGCTLEVDYETNAEETAYHTCCIHCPLLQKYVKLHGKWPPEPVTNKEVKIASDSHLH